MSELYVPYDWPNPPKGTDEKGNEVLYYLDGTEVKFPRDSVDSETHFPVGDIYPKGAIHYEYSDDGGPPAFVPEGLKRAA